MTASQPIVTLSQRRLGFCDGLCDAVMASCDAVTNSAPLSQKLSGLSWVIFQPRTSFLHDAVTRKPLTPSPRLNLRVFWDFVVFRTFSLRKRPKMLLLRFLLQKHLKWEKKRLWVKSNQIMHELGLKLTPKNITFFVSSNTLTLEICLSSSKCAFILIKIQVRGHLMRT